MGQCLRQFTQTWGSCVMSLNFWSWCFFLTRAETTSTRPLWSPFVQCWGWTPDLCSCWTGTGPTAPDPNHISSKTKIVFILIFGHHSTDCSIQSYSPLLLPHLRLSLYSIALFHIVFLVCDFGCKGMILVCFMSVCSCVCRHMCMCLLCVVTHACVCSSV